VTPSASAPVALLGAETGGAGEYSVRRLVCDSQVLRGNPLGDPTSRDVLVLVPPDFRTDRQYPVVYLLAGFGSRGRSLLVDSALSEPLPVALGRITRAGAMPPALVVLPDCSTRWGGSQYLDSAGCGRYQSHLIDEVVPLVEREFPVRPGARWRALLGKSSGGYGALLAALTRPGVFSAVLAHSPDAGFEHCYLSLLSGVLDTLADARADGGWGRLTDPAQWAGRARDGRFMVAMSLLAMGVCYLPEPLTVPTAGLPADPATGVFRDEVWRQWLAHDPVRLVPGRADRLRELDLLFLDVGKHDEYGMRWGVRALHAALGEAGVPHVFAEHDGGHHGIEYRFERSLALLGQRWSAREVG
jgi:enterochelin esterase-like enzyme